MKKKDKKMIFSIILIIFMLTFTMRIAYADPLEDDNKKKNPRYYESFLGFNNFWNFDLALEIFKEERR